MRQLYYSHDSYGLGHIRRTLSIVDRLSHELDDGSALILTGAPRAHYFDYPTSCDYVKLPSVTKADDGSYVSRGTDLSMPDLVALRSRIIRASARSFRPDFLLVDHTPTGLADELVPTLDLLGRLEPPALRILGMRDVIDEPERVRAAWRRDDVVSVLRDVYDLVLVYGQRDVFDPIVEYRIPDDVAEKFVFTGYVRRRNGRRSVPRELNARFAPRTGRLVVVTVGGGGDGNLVVKRFLQAYAQLGPAPPFEAVVVTGPLMSPRKRRRYLERASALPGVTGFEYHDDLPGLYSAADLVVAMAGYNTVCELACAGARAVLVPRSFPRREQLVRARRLERRGLVEVVDQAELEPDTLREAVLRGLGRRRPPRGWGLQLTGLDVIGNYIPAAVGRARRLRGAGSGCAEGGSP